MLVPLNATLTVIVGITHVLAGDDERDQTAGRVRGDAMDLAIRREPIDIPEESARPANPSHASYKTKLRSLTNQVRALPALLIP